MIFQVSDSSGVGEARRSASELARSLGFGENDTGRLAIVVTEAATNIVKHAKTGMIVVQQFSEAGTSGVEILAIDSGPGHSNISRCLSDGYSTAGTPGNGLGAIRRLSDTFDIFSAEGRGTIVLSHIFQAGQGPKPRPAGPQFGAVSEPYPGESVCGDAWSIHLAPNRAVVIVADGLGHGVLANEAATEAIRLFHTVERQNAVEIVDTIHTGIRHTRGCAVSVSEVNFETGVIRYCGIGNVAGSIVGANSPKRNMVSMNGTAGHNMRKAKDFSYPFMTGMMLVMHSDGLDTHCDLSTLSGLERHRASLVAAALFRGHRRSRDDATVVVMKLGGGS